MFNNKRKNTIGYSFIYVNKNYEYLNVEEINTILWCVSKNLKPNAWLRRDSLCNAGPRSLKMSSLWETVRTFACLANGSKRFITSVFLEKGYYKAIKNILKSKFFFHNGSNKRMLYHVTFYNDICNMIFISLTALN